MRLGVAIAALLALPITAAAQFAQVGVPERVYIAVPFDVEIVLSCPPPGEAPPPRRCNFGAVALFELSDRTARGPVEPLPLFPNEAVRWGPVVFHKPGLHYIRLLAEEDEDWLGEAAFLVQPPKGPVRRK